MQKNTKFQTTFKKYAEMTPGEKDCFKQGAVTANNNVKEKLGLKLPNKKK